MKPSKRNSIRVAAAAGLLAALAGCEGIGEGSTVQSIEIVGGGVGLMKEGGLQTYRIYECLRDNLVLVGTFDDGSQAGFTSRATWVSSDPSVVKVVNFDDDVKVPEVQSTRFASGVLLAQPGSAGQSAIVSATFLERTVSVVVEVAAMSNFRIEAQTTQNQQIVPPATQPAGPLYVGVGADRFLRAVADLDGRRVDLTDSISLEWDFSAPANHPTHGVNADFPDVRADPFATFDPFKSPGIVTGKNPSGSTVVTVRASFPADDDIFDEDTVADDYPADCAATAERQIIVGEVVAPLTIEHQELAAGLPPFTGELMLGTVEFVRVMAGLDVDGDGDSDADDDTAAPNAAGPAELDLSSQTTLLEDGTTTAMKVEELCDLTDDATDNPTVCDASHRRFASSFFGLILPSTDRIVDTDDTDEGEDGDVTEIPAGTPARFRATFVPAVPITVTDPLDEEAEGDEELVLDYETPVLSDDSFAITATRGELTALAIEPQAPPTIPAFSTFQFEAVGTFCLDSDVGCTTPRSQLVTSGAGSIVVGADGTTQEAGPSLDWSVIADFNSPPVPETQLAEIFDSGAITDGRVRSVHECGGTVLVKVRELLIDAEARAASEPDSEDRAAEYAACDTDALCDFVTLTIAPRPAVPGHTPECPPE